MRKDMEIRRADSCLNQSRDDEILFVLCARDPRAPVVVRGWAAMAHTMGVREDKVAEAEACATAMEEWRRRNIDV